MKRFLYPFGAFWVVLLILVGANELLTPEEGNVLSSSVVVPKEIRSRYEESIRNILPSVKNLASVDPETLTFEETTGRLEELREVILSFMVPEEYRSMHLEFVSIVDQFQTIFRLWQKDPMDEEVKRLQEEIRIKIQKIEETSPWLEGS